MSLLVFVLSPEYHGTSLISQSLLRYFVVAQQEDTKEKLRRNQEKETREKILRIVNQSLSTKGKLKTCSIHDKRGAAG